jgi:hypothetical protein
MSNKRVSNPSANVFEEIPSLNIENETDLETEIGSNMLNFVKEYMKGSSSQKNEEESIEEKQKNIFNQKKQKVQEEILISKMQKVKIQPKGIKIIHSKQIFFRKQGHPLRGRQGYIVRTRDGKDPSYSIQIDGKEQLIHDVQKDEVFHMDVLLNNKNWFQVENVLPNQTIVGKERNKGQIENKEINISDIAKKNSGFQMILPSIQENEIEDVKETPLVEQEFVFDQESEEVDYIPEEQGDGKLTVGYTDIMRSSFEKAELTDSQKNIKKDINEILKEFKNDVSIEEENIDKSAIALDKIISEGNYQKSDILYITAAGVLVSLVKENLFNKEAFIGRLMTGKKAFFNKTNYGLQKSVFDTQNEMDINLNLYGITPKEYKGNKKIYDKIIMRFNVAVDIIREIYPKFKPAPEIKAIKIERKKAEETTAIYPINYATGDFPESMKKTIWVGEGIRKVISNFMTKETLIRENIIDNIKFLRSFNTDVLLPEEKQFLQMLLEDTIQKIILVSQGKDLQESIPDIQQQLEPELQKIKFYLQQKSDRRSPNKSVIRLDPRLENLFDVLELQSKEKIPKIILDNIAQFKHFNTNELPANLKKGYELVLKEFQYRLGPEIQKIYDTNMQRYYYNAIRKISDIQQSSKFLDSKQAITGVFDNQIFKNIKIPESLYKFLTGDLQEGDQFVLGPFYHFLKDKLDNLEEVFRLYHFKMDYIPLVKKSFQNSRNSILILQEKAKEITQMYNDFENRMQEESTLKQQRITERNFEKDVRNAINNQFNKVSDEDKTNIIIFANVISEINDILSRNELNKAKRKFKEERETMDVQERLTLEYRENLKKKSEENKYKEMSSQTRKETGKILKTMLESAKKTREKEAKKAKVSDLKEMLEQAKKEKNQQRQEQLEEQLQEIKRAPKGITIRHVGSDKVEFVPFRKATKKQEKQDTDLEEKEKRQKELELQKKQQEIALFGESDDEVEDDSDYIIRDSDDEN